MNKDKNLLLLTAILDGKYYAISQTSDIELNCKTVIQYYDEFLRLPLEKPKPLGHIYYLKNQCFTASSDMATIINDITTGFSINGEIQTKEIYFDDVIIKENIISGGCDDDTIYKIIVDAIAFFPKKGISKSKLAYYAEGDM